MKYGTAELMVLAVVKPQMETTAATPSPITVGEHMQTPEIVSGKSEMPGSDFSTREWSNEAEFGETTVT
jgi:hypothetical protein